jgi:preprotein translocase subunit SecE
MLARKEREIVDKIKLAVAVLFIIAGIAGFYHYADQALLYRVLGLLVVLGVAVAIALTTQPGMATLSFGRSAILEVRKSVWPSRRETTQTTLIVMVMVILVGIMLWLFDMFLSWAMQLLIGQGG